MLNHGQDANDDTELASLLQKKKEYEEEREALEFRIQELNYNIIQVQAEYGAIYNKRVPALKLPVEVTCTIFDIAATEEDIAEEPDLRLEVVVSHVCHQWRSISLSYSRLWATFCFDTREALGDPFGRLDAYLERSASRTLELWFDFTGVPFENHLALLERTLPHVVRWRRVTILSESQNPPFSFLPHIEAVFAPNLEHFAFRCHPSDSRRALDLSINSLEPMIFRNGVPKLHSLLLDCSSPVCLPSLSNITTFRLEASDTNSSHPFSWLTFLDILSLPSLVNLSLIGRIFERPGLGRTVPFITMNNLVHLRSSGLGVLSPLLPYLRAPMLKTLIIQNDRFPNEFGIYKDPHAFPSLRSLSLINVRTVTPQVARYFVQLTERATHILISQEDFWQSFFAVLQNLSEFSPTSYWTNVKLLICNARPIDGLVARFVRFAKARPQNALVLRIFNHMDELWTLARPAEYESLKELCVVETMDADNNPLLAQYDWPPGQDEHSNMRETHDPFDVEPYLPYSP